jgi:beta-N-acetylhexosaminidase
VGGLALFNAPQSSADYIWKDPETGSEILYEFLKHSLDKVDFLAVDQEGGRVRRLRGPFVHLPSAGQLSEAFQKNQRLDLLHKVFDSAAKQMSLSGIHLNFAPDCDLLYPDSDENVIGDRSYGQRIDEVLPLIKSFCEAFENQNVHTTLKHLPGHGSSSIDSHDKAAVLGKAKEEIKLTDFKVFEAAADLASAIMPGHLVFPESPERIFSLDKELIAEFREQLPTHLRLISDDLATMKAVSHLQPWIKCYEAGYDHILICGDFNSSASAIDETIRHIESKGMEFQQQQELELKIRHASESFSHQTKLPKFKDWRSQLKDLSEQATQDLEELGCELLST